MMMQRALRILLVDDERKFLDTISKRLQLMGYDALQAGSGKEALQLARQNRIDLAIVDLKMPEMDGLVTIAKLKEIHPDLRSVLLTGYGDEKVQQATEALDAAYFQKDEMGDFWRFIRNCHQEGNTIVIHPPQGSQIEAESVGAATQASAAATKAAANSAHGRSSADGGPASGRRPGAAKIIGETLPMQQLRRDIQRFAALDCPVIIYGETGVGKELTARAIHDLSARRHQRFMSINCGAFSNDLLMEELLGKGADTRLDAGSGRAEPNGSLLLDQIEDLSPSIQQGLIKIIDSNRSTRPALPANRPLNMRIFAAGRNNLEQRVQQGLFREDLYYRLNVVELTIPPLRMRREDIPPLCSYFVSRVAREFEKPIPKISEEVIAAFTAYDFPGNVRELEHVIERAVILAENNCLKINHLPERFQTVAAASDDHHVYESLAEMEKKHILKVLHAHAGNRSKTAEVLGISRAALWRKLKMFQQQAH